MVDIKLHGKLGEAIGNTWNLAVKSVSEAIHAIEILSKHKLYSHLYENDKRNIRYQVLINKRICPTDNIDVKDIESIKNSELCMKFGKLQTIDIIPVIEGHDEGIIQAIIGVVLIVVGVVTSQPALIIAGIGMVAGGIISLISSPPKFEDFREAENSGPSSYLFNGPINVTREGGPVPVGYGRIIAGSQVLSNRLIYEDVDVENEDLGGGIAQEAEVSTDPSGNEVFGFYIDPRSLDLPQFNFKANKALFINFTIRGPSGKLSTTTQGGIWSIQTGALPTGLTLSSVLQQNGSGDVNGHITGIPTEAGVFRFLMKVSFGHMDLVLRRQYQMTINRR